MKTLTILFLLCFSTAVFAQQHVPIGAFRHANLTSAYTNATTSYTSSLLKVTLDSNATWAIHAHILTGSSAASGIVLRMLIPLGSNFAGTIRGTDSTVRQFNSGDLTDSTDGLSLNNMNAQTGYLDIDGIATTTSTTGIYYVQAKKPTSGTATLRAGSFIEAWKMR